jgi:hypothetical protein
MARFTDKIIIGAQMVTALGLGALLDYNAYRKQAEIETGKIVFKVTSIEDNPKQILEQLKASSKDSEKMKKLTVAQRKKLNDFLAEAEKDPAAAEEAIIRMQEVVKILTRNER